MHVTLTYDGATTYVDGERASLLIGTTKGAVLMITSSRRLAVPETGYDCAKQRGAVIVETIPLATALDAVAVWSEAMSDTSSTG